MNRPEPDPKRRLRARRQVWTFGALALLVLAISAGLSVRPLVSGSHDVQQVERDDLVLSRLLDLRGSLGDFQVFVEPQINTIGGPSSAARTLAIANAARQVETITTQTTAVAKLLRERGLGADARAVEGARVAFTKSLTDLGTVTGSDPPAVVAAAIDAERRSYHAARTATATAATNLRTLAGADATRSRVTLDDGRVTVLVADALAALLVVVCSVLLGQRLHRRERANRASSRRRSYEAKLQQALDMSKTESDAYRVMTKALEESVPRLDVEMLVADSSGAHFRQTLTTVAETPDGATRGCGVVSPNDCPANARGHTLVFPSSQALNACPHLVGRPSGDLSAACVAISITGRSSGVVHAMAPEGQPPTPEDITYMEITTHRVAERIAMLRAFEKSETQARTDPLTGLWNRRSFENRVRELHRDGTPFTVAYGDLDHFKLLNDTHGHEAGDQALRLFARVLRDAVRPNDITARYGGEEFVIVFPDCPIDDAAKILERLRERLALTVSSGRIPAFTVSFGLSASTDADTLDDVVAIADQALLAAKAAGRNRTMVGSQAQPPEPTNGDTNGITTSKPASRSV